MYSQYEKDTSDSRNLDPRRALRSCEVKRASIRERDDRARPCGLGPRVSSLRPLTPTHKSHTLPQVHSIQDGGPGPWRLLTLSFAITA